MRLGLGSYAVAWALGIPGYEYEPVLDGEGLIRRSAGLGLDLAQLADNVPLERYDSERIRKMIAVARESNVAIELGTRGIRPNHVRRFLALCAEFGSKLLRVVVDAGGERPEPAEVVSTVRALLPEIKAAGVTLAIENHDRFSVGTLSRIMREIGSEHVGICLDTVNSFGASEGPEVVVATLSPFVVNLHVKDFRVIRARHNMGFEITGTPAGQGQLDVRWLIEQLRGAERDPNAIIEHWPAPEADIPATIEKEARWCEESVRYMRTLISAGVF